MPKNSVIMSFLSLGRYRLPAMELVRSHFGTRLEIYSGTTAQDAAIRVLHSGELGIIPLTNHFILGKFAFQNLKFLRYLRSPVVLVDLNPRMPQIWLLLVVRAMLLRRSIVWGHAWPRRGRRARSDFIRGGQRRLASCVVTYTETQAEELRRLYPQKQIVAAPNALYRANDFEFREDTARTTFIYVGRLESAKKPLLLLDAFEIAQAARPGMELVIVGDGNESDAIATRIGSSAVGEFVRLEGHVDERIELGRFYSSAIASVSPGYVGLSLTQSLSFGVPMLIARDEPHSPEIEAARDGFNASFFDSNSAQDLARLMMAHWDERTIWRERGPAIMREARGNYTVEAMANGIIRALEGRDE